MLGKEIREPYAIIPAEPSGISMVLFFAPKLDMEDKNRIKKGRDVPKSDVVKESLFIMVLSIGNFFRAAWTRTLRFETDISHHEFMIFAAAGRVNDQNAAGPNSSIILYLPASTFPLISSLVGVRRVLVSEMDAFSSG
jgi:hypothetical protein